MIPHIATTCCIYRLKESFRIKGNMTYAHPDEIVSKMRLIVVFVCNSIKKRKQKCKDRTGQMAETIRDLRGNSSFGK